MKGKQRKNQNTKTSESAIDPRKQSRKSGTKGAKPVVLQHQEQCERCTVDIPRERETDLTHNILWDNPDFREPSGVLPGRGCHDTPFPFRMEDFGGGSVARIVAGPLVM